MELTYISEFRILIFKFLYTWHQWQESFCICLKIVPISYSKPMHSSFTEIMERHLKFNFDLGKLFIEVKICCGYCGWQR